MNRQSPSSHGAIDQAIDDLRQGARRLPTRSLDERAEWASACIDGVAEIACDWVESILRDVPARYAYHPGAKDRFSEFTGGLPEGGGDGRLP